MVIAALRGGSGKTIFSVGIIAALRNRGVAVAPFKKGPDYIDAGWLAMAAGRPCYNLDTFLIDTPSFPILSKHTQAIPMPPSSKATGAVRLHQHRGLTSTAELAKLLDLPVILCIDGTKTTRTMAAVVAGCAQFDPDVRIAGVVLNHVAGARHEKILRDSIEQHCGIPVLGAVPKLRKQIFPERHMGLVPTYEHQWAQDAVGAIAELAEKYMDLPAISALCRAGARIIPPRPPLAGRSRGRRFGDYPGRTAPGPTGKTRIGIVRDSAFQFYYPENLEALVQAGAELVVTSPLLRRQPAGGRWALYRRRFSRNPRRAPGQKRHLPRADQKLGRTRPAHLCRVRRVDVSGPGTDPGGGHLSHGGRAAHLFRFFQASPGTRLYHAPGGPPNPFFAVDQTIKGHEFHYSTVLSSCAGPDDMAFEMTRGSGLVENRDGLCRGNVLATYTHIHALGTPQWAPALVARSRSGARDLAR
jgi:cobyrinic acid a,c-diamide synthase